MPEPVTIPVSFFELTVEYQRPTLDLLLAPNSLASGIFNALAPWKPTLDDFEAISAGKNSERGLMFRLPLRNTSFFVTGSFCRFSRDNVDWSSSEETISIVETAISTLTNLTHIVTGPNRTAIGMHIQPRRKTFLEVLYPFMPGQLAALDKEPIRTMAVVAKWPNRKVTLDGSGTLANGVFLKIERDFEDSTSYLKMANQLRLDQQALFNVLGIEEDRE